MARREKVCEQVLDLVDYEEEIELPLEEVIGSLEVALAKIPPQFREHAVLSISGSEGGYASASVVYWRPKTDAEAAEEKAREKEALERYEASERATFERLMKKYGG